MQDFRQFTTKSWDGTDVITMDESPPLYDTIDTDALNAFFATPPDTDQSDIYVTFTYDGYEITARGDGHVMVEELPD